MLRACLLLLCVAGSRQLSITEFAVPSAVEAGTNAELQCRYTEERIEYLKWWWTPLYMPPDDQNRVLIYQRLSGQPAELGRKNIEGKENDTIVLLDLDPSDSGIYECEVSGDAEVRRHQDLIVFSNSTELLLNASKLEDGPDEDEDEDVLLQCEAHDVTPQPELSLFVNGEELLNLTQYVTGDADGVHYDVLVNATLADDALAGAHVRCEMFFQNRNISHPPYVEQIVYSSGAASTTEAPEDSTPSEVASELQNNADDGIHACVWGLGVAAIIQLYSYSLFNL